MKLLHIWSEEALVLYPVKYNKTGTHIAWKRFCKVKYPVKCNRTHAKAVLTQRGSVSAFFLYGTH